MKMSDDWAWVDHDTAIPTHSTKPGNVVFTRVPLATQTAGSVRQPGRPEECNYEQFQGQFPQFREVRVIRSRRKQTGAVSRPHLASTTGSIYDP